MIRLNVSPGCVVTGGRVTVIWICTESDNVTLTIDGGGRAERLSVKNRGVMRINVGSSPCEIKVILEADVDGVVTTKEAQIQVVEKNNADADRWAAMPRHKKTASVTLGLILIVMLMGYSGTRAMMAGLFVVALYQLHIMNKD